MTTNTRVEVNAKDVLLGIFNELVIGALVSSISNAGFTDWTMAASNRAWFIISVKGGDQNPLGGVLLSVRDSVGDPVAIQLIAYRDCNSGLFSEGGTAQANCSGISPIMIGGYIENESNGIYQFHFGGTATGTVSAPLRVGELTRFMYRDSATN